MSASLAPVALASSSRDIVRPLRRGTTGLLIDPVERSRRPQVHGHLDLLVVVHVSDSLMLGVGLSSAARYLHTLRHHRVLLVERSEAVRGVPSPRDDPTDYSGAPHNLSRNPDARATGRSTAGATASSVPTRISSVRARVTAV